jgi:hypothetical protein
LADDVIDVELILIFGGPTGGSNTGLTSDHVDANDKAFTTSFSLQQPGNKFSKKQSSVRIRALFFPNNKQTKQTM